MLQRAATLDPPQHPRPPCPDPDPLTSLPSLQVIDHSGARLGEYEDMSKVEKYELSQEAYDQRQSTGCTRRGWGPVGARGGGGEQTG